MGQAPGERLLVERLGRREMGPRLGGYLAIPETEQLRLDLGIGAIRDAVTVQVTASSVIPDLQLSRRAELEAGRLERYANLRGVHVDGDEDRVTHRQLADARNELRGVTRSSSPSTWT